MSAQRAASEADVAPTSPPWLRWLTRLSVAIGSAAFVVMIWLVGPRTIVEHMRTIGAFFIVIIAIDVLSSVCDGTAVYYMAHGPVHPRWRKAVVAQLVGRGINSVTPGGNLGEVVKVGLLSEHSPPKRIIAAVMYVSLMIVVVSLAFIALATPATAYLFELPHAVVVLLLIGAALVATIATGIYLLLRRGLLTSLTAMLARTHVISRARRDRWNATLGEIDRQLRDQDAGHRRRALVFIFMGRGLQKALAFLVVYAAGYVLSPGQFLALVSAGVLVGWVSTIIPLGLGILEGGTVALFALIGAPASLGLTLSLSRRVNQIVFAAIGFIVLTTERVSAHLRHA